MNDIVERIKDAENATHALFNHIFQDAREEIERLRAKIAEMEQQEPVAWLHETRRDSDVVTDAVKHVWGKAAVGALAVYSIPLYALPGAHPKLESSVPDGWKLMPIEPTQEMINHVIRERLGAFVAGKDHTFIDIYKAMLAAAPEAKP